MIRCENARVWYNDAGFLAQGLQFQGEGRNGTFSIARLTGPHPLLQEVLIRLGDIAQAGQNILRISPSESLEYLLRHAVLTSIGPYIQSTGMGIAENLMGIHIPERTIQMHSASIPAPQPALQVGSYELTSTVFTVPYEEVGLPATIRPRRRLVIN